MHPRSPQSWTLSLPSGPQAPAQGSQPQRDTGSNTLPPPLWPQEGALLFPAASAMSPHEP